MKTATETEETPHLLDLHDQLFPGFKTPRLWVAQQCRSSTPPPISRNCRHIDGSDLHRNGGGNKCTLQGVILANQNRPPTYRLLSKSADLAAKRTARLAAQYKNSYWELLASRGPWSSGPPGEVTLTDSSSALTDCWNNQIHNSLCGYITGRTDSRSNTGTRWSGGGRTQVLYLIQVELIIWLLLFWLSRLLWSLTAAGPIIHVLGRSRVDDAATLSSNCALILEERRKQAVHIQPPDSCSASVEDHGQTRTIPPTFLTSVDLC